MILPLKQILQGDSAQVLKTFPDDSIKITITSPPYDDLRDGTDYKGKFDFETIAKELYRVMAKGGVVVWVVGDQIVDGKDGGSTESGTSSRQQLFFKQIGFNVHQTIIYEKDAYMNSDPTHYARTWEYIFVLSKGRPATINLINDRMQAHRGRKYRSHHRNKDGTLEYGKKRTVAAYGKRGAIWAYATGFNGSTTDKIAFEHPAIFPEELAEDHIKSWSNEGDVILDCFAGSGTTLKAAEKLNRQWIGIEISQKYIDIAKRRIDTYLNNGRLTQFLEASQ